MKEAGPTDIRLKKLKREREGSKRKDARKTKEKGTHPGTKRGHLDRNKITTPFNPGIFGGRVRQEIIEKYSA